MGLEKMMVKNVAQAVGQNQILYRCHGISVAVAVFLAV